jgi:hypothetical protein
MSIAAGSVMGRRPVSLLKLLPVVAVVSRTLIDHAYDLSALLSRCSMTLTLSIDSVVGERRDWRARTTRSE